MWYFSNYTKLCRRLSVNSGCVSSLNKWLQVKYRRNLVYFSMEIIPQFYIYVCTYWHEQNLLQKNKMLSKSRESISFHYFILFLCFQLSCHSFNNVLLGFCVLFYLSNDGFERWSHSVSSSVHLIEFFVFFFYFYVFKNNIYTLYPYVICCCDFYFILILLFVIWFLAETTWLVFSFLLPILK